MEKVIFDASFFLSSLLPNEKVSQKVIKKFIQGRLILVEPFVFNLEVVNGLRYAFASKRIDEERLVKIIKAFQKLENINYVYDFDLAKLTKLALKFDVSIYDACYLYLKKETGYPLYSLDEKMRGSAEKV